MLVDNIRVKINCIIFPPLWFADINLGSYSSSSNSLANCPTANIPAATPACPITIGIFSMSVSFMLVPLLIINAFLLLK